MILILYILIIGEMVACYLLYIVIDVLLHVVRNTLAIYCVIMDVCTSRESNYWLGQL